MHFLLCLQLTGHQVTDLESNKVIQSINKPPTKRGSKDLTAKGIPEKDKKERDAWIRVTKGPKDKVWEEPRTEKLKRKKKKGGGQGGRFKMNIKVDKLSTGTDSR